VFCEPGCLPGESLYSGFKARLEYLTVMFCERGAGEHNNGSAVTGISHAILAVDHGE
jgi:hypothetical protein